MDSILSSFVRLFCTVRERVYVCAGEMPVANCRWFREEERFYWDARWVQFLMQCLIWDFTSDDLFVFVLLFLDQKKRDVSLFVQEILPKKRK